MKTLSSVLISFVVIAVIAYTVTFMGCSNPVTTTGTGTAPVTYPALTERDFIDTNFYAVPGSVVLLYLEHLHSTIDTTHPDTDSTGTDVVRIRLSSTIVHTVKLGDSCRFTVTIKDKMTGNIVSELDPVNNMQTVTLPEGDYIIKIRSLVEYTGGDTHQNIFYQPDKNTALSRGGGNQQVYADSNAVHTLLTTNSCSYCNLSYANLKFANLKFANLRYANLSYANLSNAFLTGANFDNANLTNANLSGAFLSSASLQNANLTNANLSSVQLDNAFLQNANLSHANLYRAFLSYANLQNANLSYANLSSTDLTAAHNLSSANLTSANLSYANLSSKSMTYCRLDYANLSHANLTNADFSHGSLTYADLTYANLTNANLTDAYVSHTNFCNAIKTGWIIHNAHTNNTQCWP